MQARSGREILVPIATAMVVALVGIAALVITERDANDNVRRNGISMTTTAALERAGATAFPSDSTAPR